jgi:hypothetical protein
MKCLRERICSSFGHQVQGHVEGGSQKGIPDLLDYVPNIEIDSFKSLAFSLRQRNTPLPLL